MHVSLNKRYIFFINILLLIIVGAICFTCNSARLLDQIDGGYMRILAKQQWEWADLNFGLSADFFQGLNDIQFPLNALWLPSYFISLWIGNGEINTIACYIIASLELFCCTYYLSYVTRLPRVVGISSGWLICFLILPYYNTPSIYPILEIIPNYADLIAGTNLAIGLFLEVGRTQNIKKNIIFALLILIIIFHIAVSHGAASFLSFPVLSIFFFFSLFSATNKQELISKIVSICFFIVSSLSTLIYIYGILSYTAASLCKTEFIGGLSNIEGISIAFHGKILGIAGPLLFCLSVAGACWILKIAQEKKLRMLAISLFAFQGAIFLVGTLAIFIGSWTGPSPLYMEHMVFPVYSLFTVNFIYSLGKKFKIDLKAYKEKAGQYYSKVSPYRFFLLPAIFIILGSSLFFICKKYPLDRSINYPYIQKQSEIIKILKDSIALAPGSTFSGRVATFTEMNIEGSIYWGDLHSYDYEMIKRWGNDHRTIGLWHNNIPTLFIYNPLISPVSFKHYKAFLERKGDTQIRNLMVLRRINPKWLALVGVRFIISDTSLSNSDLSLRKQIKHEQNSLYLYEIQKPNLGDYAPVKVRHGSFEEFVTLINNGEIDCQETVFLDKEIATNSLEKITYSQLSLEKGQQLRLKAANNGGFSLLVLPIEYSHCIDVKMNQLDAKAKEHTPRLLKVNFLQAGVLFKGEIDISLKYFTGPFHNCSCRLQDFKDLPKSN